MFSALYLYDKNDYIVFARGPAMHAMHVSAVFVEHEANSQRSRVVVVVQAEFSLRVRISIVFLIG